MTQNLDYTFSQGTDPFDEPWEETHLDGTTSWDTEDDIPDFEDMN